MRRYSRRVSAMLAMVAVGAITLAGCASSESEASDTSSGSSDTAAVTYGVIGDQGDGGSPVKGGTLTFASYAPVTSLDPTVSQPTGSTGGTEMAAVYDVLMRYDTESEKFEPQLAESLEESDDRMTWTLKLRDGVTFSDGTPLDANAVVASINRYNQRRGANSQMYQYAVKSTEVKDASTVVFTMNVPWSTFPSLLAYGHGMIVAPSAQQGEQFTPIGAGPFTFVSLQPQQEVQLKARPDYWGGAPNLDGLKFVALAGDKPKIDALQSGGVDMVYVREAQTVNSVRNSYPGFIETANMTAMIQLNGAEGRPGVDPRVRQAIAYAIDPEAIDQRASGGEGMPGTDMFQPWSLWHDTDAQGIEPDAAKAKELLEQAKADGFDGKITYVSINVPSSQQIALATQAQLNAVGFDMTVDYVSSVTDFVKRLYVDRDFDIATGSLQIDNIAPEVRLFSGYYSKSTGNILGYDSPEMDELLRQVISAPDETAKRNALGEMQKLYDTDQPAVIYGAGATFIAWAPDVYGANPTLDGIILFDKAFIKE